MHRRAVARVGLVARGGAAVPEHVVDGGRGRVAGGPATSSSTACSAQARISTSSGESCSSSSLGVDARDQVGVEARARRRCAGRGGRGCRRTASGGRGRPSGARPASARSAAAIWARLKNGTVVAVVGRDVVPGGPARERRRRAPRPSRRRARSARNAAVDRRSPELVEVALEVAHQLVLGVLPERLGDLVARERAAARRAVHGPRRAQAGLDRAEARTARRGLLSVGNQPEPKLIAFSCRLNAARVSSSAPSRSGAGGDSAGSVARVRLDRVLVDAHAAGLARDARGAGADVVGQRHARRALYARRARRTSSDRPPGR